MRSLPAAAPLLFVFWLASCGGLDEDSPGRQHAILGGEEDPGHPAVGPLRNVFCTGTLVGSRTVLTAAHCLQAAGPYSVELGGRAYAAARVIAHPGWRTEEGPWPEFNKLDWKHSIADIGVLLLQEQVVGVTPMPLSSRVPAVGQPVTLVGFGVTSDGSSGTRHKVENVVGWVGTDAVLFGTIGGLSGGGGLTCTGDSGGPALVVEEGEERVLAVHSMATCGTYTQGTRVAAYLEWLEAQAGGDLGAPADLIPPPLVGGGPAAEPGEAPPPSEVPTSGAPGCAAAGAEPRAGPVAPLLGLLPLLLRRRRAVGEVPPPRPGVPGDPPRAS